MPGWSVSASDLYRNAMQSGMWVRAMMWVVVEASVNLFVTQEGEKEGLHCRNSYIALHIPRLHKSVESIERIYHEMSNELIQTVMLI